MEDRLRTLIKSISNNWLVPLIKAYGQCENDNIYDETFMSLLSSHRPLNNTEQNQAIRNHVISLETYANKVLKTENKKRQQESLGVVETDPDDILKLFLKKQLLKQTLIPMHTVLLMGYEEVKINSNRPYPKRKADYIENIYDAFKAWSESKYKDVNESYNQLRRIFRANANIHGTVYIFKELSDMKVPSIKPSFHKVFNAVSNEDESKHMITNLEWGNITFPLNLDNFDIDDDEDIVDEVE